MFECFRKQNINFLEILFTEYRILNPAYEELFSRVLNSKEMIARYSNYAAVSCMKGMIHEKRNILTKSHPSVGHIVVEHGYDGKQLHHMERILEFFRRYIDGVPYAKCLVSEQREYLVSLKKHSLSAEKAVRRGDEIVRMIDDEVEAYRSMHLPEVNTEVDVILKDTLTSIMRSCFLKECRAYEQQVVDAVFVSVWDDGSVAIQSECKVDFRTGEVFDIGVVNVDGMKLRFCNEEYVLVGDQRYDIVELDESYYILEANHD